jgi:hypothetical protein
MFELNLMRAERGDAARRSVYSKKKLYLEELHGEDRSLSLGEDGELLVVVVVGCYRLIGPLNHRVEASNVVGRVRHGTDRAIWLGEAVASRDDAVLQPLLSALIVASL